MATPLLPGIRTGVVFSECDSISPVDAIETMRAAWEDGVDLRLMKTRSKHLMHMRDEPERYERRAPRLTHGPANGQILSL